MSGKLGHDLKVEIGLSNLNVPSIGTSWPATKDLLPN